MTKPTVLITGAAKRIGAQLCRAFHEQGFNTAIHFHHSESAARELEQSLNQIRPNSAIALKADLNQQSQIHSLAEHAIEQWQRLDVLINNASSFYPTPVGSSTEADWDALINSNVKAPYFLCQALLPALKTNRGNIINMADIYADKPLQDHSIYNIAKAANVMLTKTLAKELAPDIRVNGIAPGAIAWPAGEQNIDKQRDLLNKIPLQRLGGYNEITKAALYLSQQASYTSGQILTVDGGRSLSM
jgi:pteridine reductase